MAAYLGNAAPQTGSAQRNVSGSSAAFSAEKIRGADAVFGSYNVSPAFPVTEAGNVVDYGLKGVGVGANAAGATGIAVRPVRRAPLAAWHDARDPIGLAGSDGVCQGTNRRRPGGVGQFVLDACRGIQHASRLAGKGVRPGKGVTFSRPGLVSARGCGSRSTPGA